MSDDLKAVARRFYDLMEKWDPDELESICSPDVKGHAGAGADLELLKGSIGGFLQAFPDLRTTIRHLVREDDVVSAWVTYEGTHQEEFAGVSAAGSPVKFAAWDVFRIRDGAIVEISSACDLFTILNQIGAMPTATPPDAYAGIEQPDE